MSETTVNITAEGRGTIPSVIFAAAATLLPGMTAVVVDERECVEYVLSARENLGELYGGMK